MDMFKRSQTFPFYKFIWSEAVTARKRELVWAFGLVIAESNSRVKKQSDQLSHLTNDAS